MLPVFDLSVLLQLSLHTYVNILKRSFYVQKHESKTVFDCETILGLTNL